MSRLNLRERARGFTLVEMMLVLAMIAVLLGTAIYYMTGNLDSAKYQTAEGDLHLITTQLKGYEMENGFLPTTDQGLKALVQEPSSDPKPKHWHPWFEKLPEDPWHRPYVYRYPGVHNPNGFDLYSYGPSGQENDKEIGNWDNTAKQ
ncbi:MAG TPA: type II secretion system major pseudopilin GspG [Chthoniobacteraceae bacterium]|nr:type II secretion system major pseudopilin GspG [Chthoniobacteraceae bacterium]